MLDLTVAEVVKAVKGKLLCGNLRRRIKQFSIDSRTLKKGDFFIPLQGENYNGHSFVDGAVSKGADGVLISKDVKVKNNDITVIKVKDTLEALIKLSSYYRDKFHIKCIGITGSVGKTTAKDLIAHILSTKYNVLKSEKNYNTEIGIPLTLLKLNTRHQAAVLELAMRGAGQIKQLAQITKPQIGIITNIAESHFQFIGSLGKIARAKAELLECLPSEGTAFINYESSYLNFLSKKTKAKIFTFGFSKSADYFILALKKLGLKGYKFKVKFRNSEFEFHLPLLGRHNLLNALVSIAVAGLFKISNLDIQKALESFSPPEGRLQAKAFPNNIIILDDTYNASPTSTKSALEFLSSLKSCGKKIAVLADMLELGKIEKESHFATGKLVGNLKIDNLITVGDLAKHMARGAISANMPKDRVFWTKDNAQAFEILSDLVSHGDVVLIKGSRKMKMEEIIKELEERR